MGKENGKRDTYGLKIVEEKHMEKHNCIYEEDYQPTSYRRKRTNIKAKPTNENILKLKTIRKVVE